MTGTLTAIYKQFDDYWIGWIEEISGVNTQGKTIEEVKENLREALELIIQTNRELLEKEISYTDIIREQLSVAI